MAQHNGSEGLDQQATVGASSSRLACRQCGRNIDWRERRWSFERDPGGQGNTGRVVELPAWHRACRRTQAWVDLRFCAGCAGTGVASLGVAVGRVVRRGGPPVLSLWRLAARAARDVARVEAEHARWRVRQVAVERWGRAAGSAGGRTIALFNRATGEFRGQRWPGEFRVAEAGAWLRRMGRGGAGRGVRDTADPAGVVGTAAPAGDEAGAVSPFGPVAKWFRAAPDGQAAAPRGQGGRAIPPDQAAAIDAAIRRATHDGWFGPAGHGDTPRHNGR